MVRPVGLFLGAKGEVGPDGPGVEGTPSLDAGTMTLFGAVGEAKVVDGAATLGAGVGREGEEEGLACCKGTLGGTGTGTGLAKEVGARRPPGG